MRRTDFPFHLFLSRRGSPGRAARARALHIKRGRTQPDATISAALTFCSNSHYHFYERENLAERGKYARRLSVSSEPRMAAKRIKAKLKLLIVPIKISSQMHPGQQKAEGAQSSSSLASQRCCGWRNFPNTLVGVQRGLFGRCRNRRIRSGMQKKGVGTLCSIGAARAGTAGLMIGASRTELNVIPSCERSGDVGASGE